ncbi:MAG: sugar phosphate isomerase/epimerase [Planctomycetota bacterium]|nr:MAG: sugar phosphate isomerase/epimerase [Planctomycetota bacterium]
MTGPSAPILPSRRSFLAAAGAAAVLPLLGRAGRAAAGPTPPPFHKAVGLGMVQEDGDLLAKFRLLKELGFDGVELNAPNGYDTTEVLAARDASGLRIHSVVDSIHWDKPFSHPDPEVRAAGLAGLQAALRDAHAYGADAVLVVPAVVGKKVSYDQAWERSQAEIAKAVPLAEELGVKIAIENVWNNFLLSPLEFRRYVDSFDSAMVGAYFDAGNVVRYGWPEQWIRILGDRLLKVHVKEYSRQKMNSEGPWKGFQVELGEGDNDWPAIVAALREVGYDGWLTAEVGGGGRERLAFLAGRMDQILAG